MLPVPRGAALKRTCTLLMHSCEGNVRDKLGYKSKSGINGCTEAHVHVAGVCVCVCVCECVSNWEHGSARIERRGVQLSNSEDGQEGSMLKSLCALCKQSLKDKTTHQTHLQAVQQV